MYCSITEAVRAFVLQLIDLFNYLEATTNNLLDVRDIAQVKTNNSYACEIHNLAKWVLIVFSLELVEEALERLCAPGDAGDLDGLRAEFLV